MRILAIDPGNVDSGWCVIDSTDLRPVEFGKTRNLELLSLLLDPNFFGKLGAVAIEMVASYGMPVGREVFETCVWIGRFYEAIQLASENEIKIEFVYRMEEKQYLCHDSRAKDANIRQALISRFAKHDLKNGKGTKQNPDWFYGFAKDVWAAYAVAVTFADKKGLGREGFYLDG